VQPSEQNSEKDSDNKTRIRQYIVSTWLSGDDRGFDDDTDLAQTGVLDSFSTLSLMAFLSESLNVQIEPADVNAETFRSVNTIAKLVQGKAAT
jgi:acyl carrier protein